MVELAVYNLIKADATLLSLLGGVASNTKIYPMQAPQGTAYPYITYTVNPYGDTTEYLHREQMIFKISDPDYNVQRSIRDRLRALLDQDKNQGPITFTSADYRIVYSRLVGGQDSKDIVTDQDREETVINLNQIYELLWLDR